MARNSFSCDCNVVHHDVVELVNAQMLPQTIYEQVSVFFKVLGDPTRLRIIAALSKSELCVCDISNILGMTKSAVSHQLSTLRNAHLVKCRRDGKTVYYTLDDDHVQHMLAAGLEHVHE